MGKRWFYEKERCFFFVDSSCRILLMLNNMDIILDYDVIWIKNEVFYLRIWGID